MGLKRRFSALNGLRRSFLVSLTALLITLILVGACQKSNDHHQPTPPQTAATPQSQVDSSQYASTPQPCNLNPYSGYPSETSNAHCYQYSYYGNFNPNQVHWHYGPWYWPRVYMPHVANCGCPAGFFVVYGPYGVACAPMAYWNRYGSTIIVANFSWVGGYGYGYGYWGTPGISLQPQNYGSINIPQIYYDNGHYQRCLNQAAHGCDVRMNQCPGGSICVAIAGGSTIGLCIKNQN
ncbi:MAG: hypothetical protein NZ480_02375 [Bdellovibrionaceae bacterium]|nr:hypothetical protein [Pseudobdellovibrionaceae bacterium]MDW8189660.1 hypothetical protein [Pseudobdellovibrionaceae bacterium]